MKKNNNNKNNNIWRKKRRKSKCKYTTKIPTFIQDKRTQILKKETLKELHQQEKQEGAHSKKQRTSTHLHKNSTFLKEKKWSISKARQTPKGPQTKLGLPN
jgi:hypothetical protein